MVCKRCGEIINPGENICSKCGAVISENEVTNYKNDNSLLKIFLVVFFSVLFAMLIVGLVLKAVSSNDYDSNEEEMINMVKNASPYDHTTVTYGEAFDLFFANGQWEYFESDKHLDVVEFNGQCEYRDTEVNATIQFVLHKNDNMFDIDFLAFNDIPQDNLTLWTLLDVVFEDYN
jgi:predicted nucleic acid-binding Zn ribbon protein